MISSFIWIYTKGAILNCDYSSNDLSEFGDFYQCNGELLQLNENDTIIKSVTKPSDNYISLRDVTELRIENQNLIRFPSNAEKFFKIIQVITVKNATIKDISNEMLKDFSSLIYLDLSINQISVIPKDLFIYNQNIYTIH